MLRTVFGASAPPLRPPFSTAPRRALRRRADATTATASARGAPKLGPDRSRSHEASTSEPSAPSCRATAGSTRRVSADHARHMSRHRGSGSPPRGPAGPPSWSDIRPSSAGAVARWPGRGRRRRCNVQVVPRRRTWPCMDQDVSKALARAARASRPRSSRLHKSWSEVPGRGVEPLRPVRNRRV